MARLQYGINLTLDGCCDHQAGVPDPETHQFWSDLVGNATVLYGRVTYKMMEEAWRPIAESGLVPDGMADWVLPFARSMHAARKFVASRTLTSVDWNAQLLGPDLKSEIERLKRDENGTISLGGVDLAGQIAACGLIDDFVFVINPRIAGHGPTLFAGLPSYLDLKLTGQHTFGSGAIALTYEARR